MSEKAKIASKRIKISKYRFTYATFSYFCKSFVLNIYIWQYFPTIF